MKNDLARLLSTLNINFTQMINFHFIKQYSSSTNCTHDKKGNEMLSIFKAHKEI